MQAFIQQIKFRKKIATYFIIGVVLLISAGFFYITASETLAMGIELLGEERYTARMNDSYLFAALLLLMAIPMHFSLNPFFKRYIEVVKTLSNSEIERLHKQNETAPLFNSYLPGYIAKDKSVIFFKLFRTTEIRYADITKISLSSARRGYFLHIKTKQSFFIGMMAESFVNLSKLIALCKEVNPGIVVSLP